jgi:hypothetical protein
MRDEKVLATCGTLNLVVEERSGCQCTCHTRNFGIRKRSYISCHTPWDLDSVKLSLFASSSIYRIDYSEGQGFIEIS